MDQVHRNSSSLVAKAVVKRLVLLRQATQKDDDKKDHHWLDERAIRKQTRQLQEVMGYLNYYLKQTIASISEPTTIAAPAALFLDVFQAGLETLVAILQSSEHFRHALMNYSNGWNMLVELLRRHNVRLRMLVCQVMTLCFVEPPPFTAVPQQQQPASLSTANQQWNNGIVDLLTDATCWSVLFDQPHTDWGMQATRMTTRLMVLLCRASTTSIVMTRESRVWQLVQTLDALSDQYMQHSDVLMARFRALEERFQDIVKDRDALTEARDTLFQQVTALEASSVRDAGRMQQIKQAALELHQRSDALTARLDEYKKDIAAIR